MSTRIIHEKQDLKLLFCNSGCSGQLLPVPGMGNSFQGMPDKNAGKYPGRWVYSWPAPSFLSKGL